MYKKIEPRRYLKENLKKNCYIKNVHEIESRRYLTENAKKKL